MLDHMQSANRTAPASRIVEFDLARCAALSALPAEARWSLRLSETDARDIGLLAGFDLGGDINTARTSQPTADDTSAAIIPKRAFRLGPDEWLLNAPEKDRGELQTTLDRTLANRPHGLVDISDRQLAMRVTGPRMSAVLASGCLLDLDRFPPGMATRTMLAKAEVILHRASDGSEFEIQVWRSFAKYLSAFLAEAANMERAISEHTASKK